MPRENKVAPTGPSPLAGMSFAGGVCFAITTSGEVVAKGFGDIDKENVEAIATKMVLMAARLRNAARNPPSSAMLN